MDEKRIFLVQGPPGTGKTSTIIGMIEMILASHENAKILLCAPSNNAVDEVFSRIIKKCFNGM